MNIEEEIFEILKLLIPAFAGAFFAFLFLRFADWGKKKKNIRDKNIRALNRIQLICNENHNFLNDSIYNIDEIIKVIEEARKRKQSPFSENHLDKITNDKILLLDLVNNAFVNDYFSYAIMVEKHNNDVDSINHFHESMKMARLTGQISVENYIENMSRFGENIKLFKKFCSDSMDMTQDIIAKCRVQLKDETSLWKKLFKKPIYNYDKTFNKKYAAELVLLKKELDQITNASKERIKKVVSEK